MDTFRLLSPNMKSNAIAAFQVVLNQRFADWKIANKLDPDHEYGTDTDRRAHQVCHGLGINPKTYRDGFTPAVRVKIHRPERRTDAEKALGEARKPWVAALRKNFKNMGPEQAIKYGRKHLGTHESPMGSNTGPLIDKWNVAVGTSPGPNALWCGAFVNACLHAGGIPNHTFMAFCPNIESQAKGRLGGWMWVPQTANGRPGDLALYTEPAVSTSQASHVELLIKVEASTIDVIGGNTSPAPGSGDQSNGGTVAEKHRDPTMSSFKLRGYARPPWAM